MYNIYDRVENIDIYLTFETGNFEKELNNTEKIMSNTKFIEELNKRIKDLLDSLYKQFNFCVKYNVKQIINIEKTVNKIITNNGKKYIRVEGTVYLLLDGEEL